MKRKKCGEKRLRKPQTLFSQWLNKKSKELNVRKLWKSKYRWNIKTGNCWKGGKIYLKINLIEQKSCNFLQQLRNKVVAVECKKRPISNFKWRKIIPLGKRNKKKESIFKKVKNTLKKYIILWCTIMRQSWDLLGNHTTAGILKKKNVTN